ncbi:hypothetical protein CERZMDRAFT_52851 [Cercospora zeae-maydis SCOH1-5]|uniref:Cytochrome P450 n=1 Tax=Cercospora zeae-maydis SCOH1-5 TaxID=717836 RepID=A0A6A6EYQ6_9PEZI|nr:hypothetical protein CERZMDRAFT_52851 [Cercospora zeae-maydis SCOH1-5]
MALLGLTAFALSIALLYRLILHPLYLNPLAKIPAVHPFAKISSLYMLWIRYWDRENATVFAAHEKYGAIVRLGPNELSVNCIDDGVRTVYGKGFDRHEFYRVYEDCGRQNLSSSLDAISHSIRKKRITHVYSKSYLQSSPAVVALIDRLVRHRFLALVSARARDQKPFDTMTMLSALALDLVLGYTFGVRNATDFLNNSSEHSKCIERIHTGRPYSTMFWLHEFPSTVDFLERVGVLSKERYESLEALHVFCLDMCHRAEAALEDAQHDSGPEDFPTVYQQFRRSLDKEGVSIVPSLQASSRLSEHGTISCSPQQLEIAAEVGDQIHASDETLSITLTYAIWELSRNKDMQQKLRLECQALGQEVHINSTTALPTANEIDQLPLLHAVMMETMRVHPIVAGGQARVTPYGKLTKLGEYENIPGGCRVQSYARFLHHNADVFPNPLAWFPERWLEAVEPGVADPKMRWFWAFSSGGRMCLGSHFAQLVMKYVLVLIYANFETYIVDDTGIEHMEGYVGGPKSGKLMVSVRAVTWNTE